MNNKGQALVEFILIIPAFMLILLAIIDVSNIAINKYKLEDNLNMVVELYQNKETSDLSAYIHKNNLTVNYNTNDKYTNIEVKKSVSIKTPILNNILGKNMPLKASRTIYSE